MKDCYSIKLSPTQIALADITFFNYADHGFYPFSSARQGSRDCYGHITRIHVPEALRGRGHGTQLLNQMTEDADREGVMLQLYPAPYGRHGGLGKKSVLVAWYERHGFVRVNGSGILRREPKASPCDSKTPARLEPGTIENLDTEVRHAGAEQEAGRIGYDYSRCD